MAISEYKTKPWEVACDECGDRIDYDDIGGTVLFDTRDEAVHEATTIFEWRVEGEVVTCPACVDEEALAAVSPSAEETNDDA